MIQRATFTAKEAAEYLGISYWLLLEMVKRGEISPIRAGRRYLFRQSGLDEWMTQQERKIAEPRKNESLKLVKAR